MKQKNIHFSSECYLFYFASLISIPCPVFVRLVDGRTPYEGRVEVFYQDQWGTVCDDGWGIEEANVVCRQLGYPSASRVWTNAHFGQGSGSFAFTDLNCAGNESSIEQCQHSGWSDQDSCSYSKDGGVTCGEERNVTGQFAGKTSTKNVISSVK